MERSIAFRKPTPKKSEGLSRVAKTFFGLNIFQVFVIGGIQGSMMALGDFKPVIQGGMGPGRQVYVGLFMGAVIYSCFLCLFAIKKQNFLEIAAFVMQNYGYIAYSFIQVYHIGFKKNFGVKIMKNPYLVNLSIVNSTMLFILNIIFTLLAVRLYVEYGWKIYKRVRFHMRLRASFHVYELVICLLKMVLLFVWMFAICLNRTVLRNHETNFAFIVSLVSIPAIILVSILGVVAIRKEIRLLMYIFFCWVLIAIGYFGYKIIRVYKSTCTGCEEFSTHTEDIPDEVKLHLIYLGSVNVIFLLLLLLASVKALRNFGIGLKKHFQGQRHTTLTMLSMSQGVLTSILNTSRASIDAENINVDSLQLSSNDPSKLPYILDQQNRSPNNISSDLDMKFPTSRPQTPNKRGSPLFRIVRRARIRLTKFLRLGNRGANENGETQNSFSSRGCLCCAFLRRSAHDSRDVYCQTEAGNDGTGSFGAVNQLCLNEVKISEEKLKRLKEFSSSYRQQEATRHMVAHRQISLPSENPCRTAAVISSRLQNMKHSDGNFLKRSVSAGKVNTDAPWYCISSDVTVIPEEKDECYSSLGEDSDSESMISPNYLNEADSCKFSSSKSSEICDQGDASSSSPMTLRGCFHNEVAKTELPLNSFTIDDQNLRSDNDHKEGSTSTPREAHCCKLKRSKSSISSYASAVSENTDITFLDNKPERSSLSVEDVPENRVRKPSVFGSPVTLKHSHSFPADSRKVHIFSGDFEPSDIQGSTA